MCNRYFSFINIIVSFSLLCIVITGLSSCATFPIPLAIYEPDHDAYISDDVHLLSGEMLITVGPQDLLEQVAEAITETDARIEIADPDTFIDAAFPDGDARVSRLLEKGNCQQVSSKLDIDFLALIGKTTSITESATGGLMGPDEFYLGAAIIQDKAIITATIIDLKNESPLCDITSSSKGVGGILGLLLIAPVVISETKTSAQEGLGHEIGKAVAKMSIKKNLRIAVLAVEHPLDVAVYSRKEYLIWRYNEGDNSYELLTQLALLGTIEPLEQLAWKGDIKAAIYLYNLTGVSGPLNKLAEQGNQQAIAHKFGGQSRIYQSPQQIDIIVEQGANGKVRTIKEKELESALSKRAEAGDPEAQFELYMLGDKTVPRWLCRSADQGYTAAAMWLGYVLETGTYGFTLDYTQSYIWYRRAAIGEQQQEIDKTIKKIKEEAPKLYLCKGAWCHIAQKIVDLEGKLSTKKLSTAKYKLEQWIPGECERIFVDAKTNN